MSFLGSRIDLADDGVLKLVFVLGFGLQFEDGRIILEWSFV